MGSHKVKKCEICGQIYDDNSTICLGLFCRHNELIEVYVENSGPSVSDTNKSKKCPKCGKNYDSSWKVCLDCNTPLENIAPPKTDLKSAKKCPYCKGDVE